MVCNSPSKDLVLVETCHAMELDIGNDAIVLGVFIRNNFMNITVMAVHPMFEVATLENSLSRSCNCRC